MTIFDRERLKCLHDPLFRKQRCIVIRAYIKYATRGALHKGEVRAGYTFFPCSSRTRPRSFQSILIRADGRAPTHTQCK